MIGAGASPDFRTVTIDRGSSEGVRTNMAVIAPAGVVGRIVTSMAHASKVQLLIDRNAGAGALVERSRAQGVILGPDRQEGNLLRMDYVSSIADVKVGDMIVTSGIDGIFPKGFPHRESGAGGPGQRHVQGHSRSPGGGLHQPRGSPGREITAIAGEFGQRPVVRAAGIFAFIVVSLALQTTLARFLTPGANLIDLVFVAVVCIALAAGPGAGLVAGAIAGLTQDALSATGASVIAMGAGVATSRSIIGIGGLAKTVIGFVTGIIGTQFIVARPIPRALVFFTATLGHAIIFLGLYSVVDPGYGGTPYGTVLSQAGVNALTGVVIFQIGESLPGFMDRRSGGNGMRINRRLD